MSKPTVIIVPGACHNAEHWKLVKDIFTKEGFKAHALTLPSVVKDTSATGEPLHSSPSIEPDVQTIRNAILAAFDRGEDVAVVCHSYGGMPSSEAVKGLGKSQRESQDGESTGVVRMCYIAAVVVDKGQTVQSTLAEGGVFESEIVPVPEGPPLIRVTNPREAFFHDVPEEIVDAILPLGLQSAAPMGAEATNIAWKEIESSYLICTDDRALKPSVQESFVAHPEGNWVFVERIPTSHSPFLSAPDRVVEHVKKALQANVKLD